MNFAGSFLELNWDVKYKFVLSMRLLGLRGERSAFFAQGHTCGPDISTAVGSGNRSAYACPPPSLPPPLPPPPPPSSPFSGASIYCTLLTLITACFTIRETQILQMSCNAVGDSPGCLIDALQHCGQLTVFESFNASIWHLVPKEAFSSSQEIRLSLMMARLYYNQGRVSANKLLFSAAGLIPFLWH